MALLNREVTTFREGDRIITLRSLALPLILQYFITYLIDTLGVLALSGYSELVVSAISVGNQVVMMPMTILKTVATGTVILASIALGQELRDRAARVCGNGLLAAAVLSTLVGVGIFLLADKLAVLMNLTGTTRDMTADYLRIVSVSIPIQALFDFFQRLLICNGHSGVIVISGLATGVLNAGLSYAVIYAPELPCPIIAALGWKTCLAWLVGLVIVFCFFRRYRCPIRPDASLPVMGKILMLGLPAGMCGISYTFANTATTGFLATFGETALNTRVYINNIVQYVPLTGLAIAASSAVLMGRHRGGGRFDSMKILFRQNLMLILPLNVTLALLAFLFRTPLLSLFTADPEVFRIAALVMLADIPLEVFRGVNHVGENSLNPNGDVKFTMIISVFSAWAFSVLLGYVLCVLLGWGLIGLWIGFLTNEAFKAISYLLRWRSGKWANVKI